jgi:hypothetical protein
MGKKAVKVNPFNVLGDDENVPVPVHNIKKNKEDLKRIMEVCEGPLGLATFCRWSSTDRHSP